MIRSSALEDIGGHIAMATEELAGHATSGKYKTKKGKNSTSVSCNGRCADLGRVRSLTEPLLLLVETQVHVAAVLHRQRCRSVLVVLNKGKISRTKRPFPEGE